MRYLIAGALFLLAASCTDMVSPPAAAGYVRFDPPAEYAQAWTEIEQCSGFTGNFSKVKFFVYPNEIYIPGHDHAGAMSHVPEQEIYVAGLYQDNLDIIRHEYLHVMGKLYCHEPKYFDQNAGVCKKIVYPAPNDC